MRSGYSLFEMCAVLVLMGLTSAALWSGGRGFRDRASVVGAREAVAGLVAEARAAALLHGGAEVRVVSGPWRAWYDSGGRVGRNLDVEREWGVRVTLRGSRDSTSLRYDALGLGRVASETFRFHRGRAESALVVSGYGRVRRR